MDSYTYKLLMGEIGKTCIIPHHLFPGYNLLLSNTVQQISKNLNDPEELTLLDEKKQFLSNFPCFEPFNYKVRSCFPIHSGSNDVDKALNSLKKKLFWERRLRNIKISNVDAAIKTVKQMQKNKNQTLSKNLKNYLQLMGKDPEPYFSGSYNWMYTGGNLSVLDLKNEIIVIGSDISDKLPLFNVFKLQENSRNLSLQGHLSLKRNSPILQLSAKSMGDGLFILSRQKNIMSLFAIRDIDQCHIIDNVWKKKARDTKFLTSVDITDACDKVISSDTKEDVHVYDVETKKKTFGFVNYSSARDNWNEAKAEKDMIYMANRNCFYIIDPRQDKFDNPVFEYSPLEGMNPCDEISSMARGLLDSDYMYLGTTHHLLQVDIRNRRNLQRWTHQMRKPPLFIECSHHEGKDFVFLQSCQRPETIGIINGYANDDEDSLYYHSRCLPKILTDFKSTLTPARMKGLCLNPRLTKRFDFSVTGIQCFKRINECDIQLLTQSAGGDIFLSRITKKREDEDDSLDSGADFLEKMAEYENNIENMRLKRESDLRIETENFAKIKNDLLNCKVKRLKTKEKTHWQTSEMYEEGSLIMYRDLVAQKILKVWGIESEERELDQEMTSSQKVKEWMEKFQ